MMAVATTNSFGAIEAKYNIGLAEADPNNAMYNKIFWLPGGKDALEMDPSQFQLWLDKELDELNKVPDGDSDNGGDVLGAFC